MYVLLNRVHRDRAGHESSVLVELRLLLLPIITFTDKLRATIRQNRVAADKICKCTYAHIHTNTHLAAQEMQDAPVILINMLLKISNMRSNSFHGIRYTGRKGNFCKPFDRPDLNYQAEIQLRAF
jgi:hypothetical protein